jgi:short-subunit dehydrogenase
LVIELAGSGIAVSCVHPGGVKTGIARNGRHFDAANAEVSAQMVAQEFEQIAQTSSEQAAAIIIAGMQHKRPRIMVGLDAKIADFLQRISPTLVRKVLILMSVAMNKRRFGNADPNNGSSKKVA